jgi:3-aminobutyryl-CoA ammonia-lyase
LPHDDTVGYMARRQSSHDGAWEVRKVMQRRYVGQENAHYGGGVVDGSFVLRLFGDAATELCVITDGDEGLFASYSDVQFLAPVLGGDVIEVEAEVTSTGIRSRKMSFVARVVCRSTPELGLSAATVLPVPIDVVRAQGTVVVSVQREAGTADDGALDE